MSDQIIPLYNYNPDDDRPLPERIANLYGFKLAFHDVDGIRYYAVQDWITGVVPFATVHKLWSKFKQHYPQMLSRWRQLPYVGSNRKTYPTDHATAESLYLITQRMEANSGNRDDILLYLAKAGVVLDDLVRDPEKAEELFAGLADEKEYHRLLNEGFSHEQAIQWVEVRRSQKQEWNRLRAEWNVRGVADGIEYARLTNNVTEVATGKSATSLKRSMQIDGTPRDYLCAADNAAIEIVSVTTRILHRQRDSQGVDELSDDVKSVKPIIDAARPKIDEVFSKKPRRLPPGKPLNGA